MSNPPLSLEIENGLAHLGLGNPPRNELTVQRLGQLRVILEELRSLPGITGLIISGKGRHFSSGANIEELAQSPALADSASLTRNRQTFDLLENAPFPVVGAISGCCFGVGLELALACHFRIATIHAVFALPEVEYGLIPGCGGTVRLREKIGTGPTIELILSGRTCSAEEAYNLGFVDRVVPQKELVSAAILAIQNANEAGYLKRNPEK